MLVNLHIENYALIRETDIEFDTGFVVITGETGAGKSIMLGALGMLLGQRASTAILADKERKCVVEAQFNVAGLGLETFFHEADIDYDDHLILRREVLPSAKSRAFANDTPVQLSFLQQLGAKIIDIHSQHQTLTLSNRELRIGLLDALAEKDRLTEYRTAYNEYIDLKHNLEALTESEAESHKEQDYLQFQLNELAEANLHEGEQEQLEQESLLLSHAEAVKEGLATATLSLDDDSDTSVLARLRSAKSSLGHIAAYHTDAEALLRRVESSLIELDDICNELHHSAEGVNFNPEHQQQVDERLALIYRLEKKHGVQDIAALISLQHSLDEKLQAIESLDSRIHELMEAVDIAFSAMQSAAEKLTASRVKAAQVLSSQVLPTLKRLGMAEARFEAIVDKAEHFSPLGHDTVQLLFNANRGGELRDVSQVASGGELSRLMLAIKSTLTSCQLLPTIIFDEIDTGVSGDIAGAVAKTLHSMASRMQVVAITHLPQIAAQASQHLKVYKQVENDRTVSHIRRLDTDERIHEVASMLSSGAPTQAALQTARELMELC
ncbi:MAG: DNA repair protein RecN [Bacteroidales bacterium]|nr:DNA repair protein RecN [Bacteroidales bacterium]